RLAPLIVGRRLARKLNVRPGERVTVFGVTSPAGGGMEAVTYRAAQFELVGLYETGMAEYDDIYAYTDLQSAQHLFQMGGDVSGFDVLVHDVSQVATAADQIQELLGYPFYAKTMFDMYKNLFAWIELQKKPIPIVLGLIIIVATVNIIGTLLMLVMEKTHEVGVLKSMGATTGGITKIFFIEGLFIALVGTVLGNVLGFGLCWIQLQYKFFSLPSGIYFMDTVPILLQAKNFVIVSLIAISLSLIATVLPSRLAGRLDPLLTIRFR
ncbi:MAG: ABC transporter permease, partial [Bacteroidota bacterium]